MISERDIEIGLLNEGKERKEENEVSEREKHCYREGESALINNSHRYTSDGYITPFVRLSLWSLLYLFERLPVIWY